MRDIMIPWYSKKNVLELTFEPLGNHFKMKNLKTKW